MGLPCELAGLLELLDHVGELGKQGILKMPIHVLQETEGRLGFSLVNQLLERSQARIARKRCNELLRAFLDLLGKVRIREEGDQLGAAVRVSRVDPRLEVRFRLMKKRGRL